MGVIDISCVIGIARYISLELKYNLLSLSSFKYIPHNCSVPNCIELLVFIIELSSFASRASLIPFIFTLLLIIFKSPCK